MSECTTFAAALARQMAQHEGLVRWVVRQQRLLGLPFDDALHEGRIGLWRALLRYDPCRGTAFSTYAVPAIAHAVWDAVATQHLTAMPLVDHAHEAADPADLVHAQAVRDGLLALVRRLPPHLRLVIVAHYGLDGSLPLTFAAIGRTLGLTRQRVQQLHLQALLWLAQPAHSLPLRRLLERHDRLDYQKTLARQRRLARARRCGRRAGR
ncbi:MAG: sigma-70 family RNA polymerase sigma factor [Anaerolineae bacterium]|nr:sigma-70 family RNA polymerase sigma factor [Anaerolineae bacterium]